jgi:hypothetical protein
VASIIERIDLGCTSNSMRVLIRLTAPLEMLSRGTLSEKSALAAMGTHQDAYSVAPVVRIKALELVEESKLSERGLLAILGV